LISRLPGIYDDWLVCMITSQTKYYIEGFDEIINEDSSDFLNSGLNVESLIRIGRLAVVEGRILIGKLGEIDSDRLSRIKEKIADWLIKI
jgi:mRNA interferase MazF